MRTSRLNAHRFAVTATAIALGAVAIPGTAAGAVLERVSVDSAGNESQTGNFLASQDAEISAGDGRYVVFQSDATTLVAGDTNNAVDIFLRDRVSGTTQRVSVASDGTQANGGSWGADISADGRYVVFSSGATNLVTDDTNGFMDVFVHDMLAATTERVSVDTAGAEAGGPSGSDEAADYAVISPDGRYVAFSSEATNLVSGVPEFSREIYVRDLVSDVTERVSVPDNEGPTEAAGARAPGISEGGRYVTFGSTAGNLVPGDTNGREDVFLRDRIAGTTERISVSSTGAEAPAPWDSEGQSTPTPDGRYVVFQSNAPNLVTGDLNGDFDVFVRDRVAGTTVRASVSTSGGDPDLDSFFGSISDDGRFVAFQSGASNLVAGDGNGKVDIFVRDLQTGTTETVSVVAGGVAANGHNVRTAITANGRLVAFESDATNLVPSDGNGKRDIFVTEVESAAGSLAIEGVTHLADPVPRLGRFEAAFDLTSAFDNPFDPDEIAVDVTFTAPSGAQATVPAFWYGEFSAANGGSGEEYTPQAGPEWRVRFAPFETGTYTYEINAVSADASADPFSGSFVAVDGSTDGFVQVDPLDPVMLAYESGSPYLPLGHNVAFEDGNPALDGTAYYADVLASLGLAGENWTRIWMTDFNGSALEWGAGHYTGYYAGPGRYALEAGWRMDRILELAEQNGLQVQLVLNDHGQFSTWVNARWGVRCETPPCEAGEPGFDPGNPYSQANGGPVPDGSPQEFFTSPAARDLFKQRLRYVVARWGAFGNVLAWELFNEVQFVGTNGTNVFGDADLRQAIVAWHDEMSAYLQALDPYGHLVTTSSHPSPVADGLAALPGIDLLQIHTYEAPPADRNTQLDGLIDQLQADHGKPVLVGEFGIGSGDPEANFDPPAFGGTQAQREHLEAGTHLHNELWAAALSRSGAMSWWWGNYIAADPARSRTSPGFPLNERLFPPLRQYLDGELWSGLELDDAELTTSPEVLALGLTSETFDQAYVWVRDADNEYGTGARPGDLAGRVVSGATVTVGGLDNGTYAIDVWDTWNGGVVDTLSAASTGGELVVALPDFTRDVGLKIVPGAGDPNPPEIELRTPPDGTVYVVGQEIWADFSCTDLESEPSCIGDVPLFAFIDTSTPGEHTFTVTATDEGGNVAQVTHTYFVVDDSGPDDDGDGLPDDWEIDGIDADGDGQIDLDLAGTYGADPAHKDLFVEVDYMEGVEPDPDGLQDVVDAFARAPVANPDGVDGITLHVLVDEQLEVMDPFAYADFDELKLGHADEPCDGAFGTAFERAGAGCEAALAARRLAFRYALFGYRYSENPTSSGWGELLGNDFVVTLGSWSPPSLDLAGGQRAAEAATFMHELGHNLNLHHGGGDPVNCKPNYLSVMSYSLQFPNIDLDRPLDYSDGALATLHEGTPGLSEPAGIGGPEGRYAVYTVGLFAHVSPADDPIDWNVDGDATDTVVGTDVNRAAPGCNGSGSTLTGHDDWANLAYDFRSGFNFADGARQEEELPDETTEEDVIETPQVVDSDGDGRVNAQDNCPADANAGQHDLDADGAGDACDAESVVGIRVDPSRIKVSSGGYVSVAILSSPSFDATARLDPRTPTFGKTGNEASLQQCETKFTDVNKDRRKDVVCRFHVRSTGLRRGDTVGTLHGRTRSGDALVGRAAIVVV